MLLKEQPMQMLSKSNTNTVPSVFSNQPAATIIERGQAIARLAVAFPQMNKSVATATGNNQRQETLTIWTIIGEQFQKLGLSKQRIDYIVDWMLQNYRYPTFTVADLLSIDKQIMTYTEIEADRLPLNHEPLARAKMGDKWRICKLRDAQLLNLTFRPYYTTPELIAQGKL